MTGPEHDPDGPQVERVALVVGGASGIGAAVVEALRADGCRVSVADLAGGEGVMLLDVTDEAAVAAVLDEVVAREGRLDVVVNTAGISGFGLVVEHDTAQWRQVVDVCLTGSFILLKQAGQRMGEGGSIVTLTSLNARQPGRGLSAYCAAKAGLAMLTEVAALELAERGVRVNAVSPGLVVTPLTQPAMDIPGVREDYLANTPLGRPGTPEEVAEAVVFVARAGWLTGEVLDLNGGAHLMRYPDVYGLTMRAFS